MIKSILKVIIKSVFNIIAILILLLCFIRFTSIGNNALKQGINYLLKNYKIPLELEKIIQFFPVEIILKFSKNYDLDIQEISLKCNFDKFKNFPNLNVLALLQLANITYQDKKLGNLQIESKIYSIFDNMHGVINYELNGLHPVQGQWQLKQDGQKIKISEINFKLQKISNFLASDIHKFGGDIALNVSFNLNNIPSLFEGSLILQNGFYKNYEYGTKLQNIKLQILANEEKINIANISAQDSKKGTLKGDGNINLDDLLIKTNVVLDNLEILNNDFLLIKIFKGTLQSESNLKSINIKGNIVLDNVSYNVTDLFGYTIPTLNINRDSEKNIKNNNMNHDKDAGLSNVPIKLDIVIKSKKNVHVYGVGIDTYWNGDLHLTNNLANVKILGNLQLQHGSFSFLYNNFHLTKGKISFTGHKDNIPYLEIVGNVQKEEITIQVLVSGIANNPVLKLKSTPYLSQEDLIARILFGKNKGKLSVLQAIQLATIVKYFNAFGGKESGGFSNFFKNSLNLDELTIGGLSFLQLNKHFSDKVEIDFNYDQDSINSKIGIIFKITPNILAIAEKGIMNAREKIGLRYKKDY